MFNTSTEIQTWVQICATERESAFAHPMLIVVKTKLTKDFNEQQSQLIEQLQAFFKRMNRKARVRLWCKMQRQLGWATTIRGLHRKFQGLTNLYHMKAGLSNNNSSTQYEHHQWITFKVKRLTAVLSLWPPAGETACIVRNRETFQNSRQAVTAANSFRYISNWLIVTKHNTKYQ